MTSSELTAVTELVDDVMADPPPADVGSDEVSEALLAAGREMIEAFGIRRLRMDDVARQAGYGRATLYRRFATRDDLVWAVVTRETRRTLFAISDRIADIAGLADRVVEAFSATVEEVRGNALVRRLLQIEPDLLLPHLTTRGDAGLAVGRRLMRNLLREGQAEGHLRGIDADAAAELIVRTAHSLILTPDGPVDVDDPEALRRFARTILVDPLFRLSTP